MSGMDRLTDEEWAVQYLEDDAEACSAVNGSHDQTTKDARRMEVLVKRLIRERDDAHRRASQVAPAPSDGLREAVPLGLVEALRSGRQADMDGVMVTVSRQACEMAADILSALAPAPAQEGEPRHD